jgi:hypothetical protein
MSGIMARFVKDPAGWLKGPYLQLGLPFTPGASDKQFFKGFETQFSGFSHQEAAWQRLSSLHMASSTLVATGTGSGKTECFVYPVLDHCARALAAKEAGVKALVIYPMNALASDQARRFAELVATVPAFKGLRVGLYVGGNAVGTGQGTVMTPTAVITDPPVVTAAQLQRILGQVAKVAKDGDAQSKGALLSSRFAGPALQQRTAYYTLRKLDKKLKALPAIAGKPITFSLPAASSLWPRAIMAVTDEAGAPSPQMLVLVQETPRAQYQLWYYIRLMQGASIPLVPVADIGAIPVASDAKFLKAVPSELPSIYGSIIDNGAGIAGAERFALTNDEFFKQISQSQDAQVAALKNGKITFTHKLGSTNVVALATADGGALVALSMIDGYTIRPTKRGSAITVTGLEKTLLGASGSPTGVVSKYSDMLLFYVPQTGSDDRIRLLGVTQGLLSIRSR